jgi:short subunit dehydrogenase-like uncharacterized protein
LAILAIPPDLGLRCLENQQMEVEFHAVEIVSLLLNSATQGGLSIGVCSVLGKSDLLI